MPSLDAASSLVNPDPMPGHAKPLVSVVIPAWNAESVLAEALASMRDQTWPHWEAVIVDDGSTDLTAQVAVGFVEADSRFRLIRQTHAGVSAARNAALRDARGQLIAFLDADDVWLPAKLARQIEALSADPKANFCFTNYWFWDGQRDLSRRYAKRTDFPEGDATSLLCSFDPFGTSTVMVKREALEKTGGFDENLAAAEDWDLWLRMSENGLWARGVWEPQARYRKWAGNVSAKRIDNIGFVITMFENALKRPQPPARRRLLDRSLRRMHGHRELLNATNLIAAAPQSVPPAILRAWSRYPARVKWLLWYLGAAWPPALGGRMTSGIVHRKLLRRCRPCRSIT